MSFLKKVMEVLKKVLKLLNKKYILGVIILLGLVLTYLYFTGVIVRKTEMFANKKKIVFFYLPGCGHCDKIKPVWNKLKSQYSSNSLISLSDVDSSISKEADKYQIKAFPTIVYMDKQKIVDVYSGDRSYEDIRLFIESSASN